MNTMLAAMCYNREKLDLFRVCFDVTLYELKDQLNQTNDCLNYIDTRMVDNVEHRRLSINLDGCIRST